MLRHLSTRTGGVSCSLHPRTQLYRAFTSAAASSPSSIAVPFSHTTAARSSNHSYTSSSSSSPHCLASSTTIRRVHPSTILYASTWVHRSHRHQIRFSTNANTNEPATPSSSSAPSTSTSTSTTKPKRTTLKTLRYDLKQGLATRAPWLLEWMTLVKIELSLVVTMSSFFGCMLAGSDAWSTQHVIANFAGTAMCAAAAAIGNQYLEIEHDAKMARTAKRPLVTGAITKMKALTAAPSFALGGAALLHYASQGDWVAPALGLGTIVAYVGIYTPLKRLHRWNTELGAIVGSVPVLIGWSCAISHWSHHMISAHGMHLPFTTLQSLMMPHALYGFMFLVAWQMQHFMTIAFQYQDQYAGAGYVMMRGKAALKKGIMWTGILCAMPFLAVPAGVVSPMFLVTSSAINAFLVRTYYQWYRSMRDSTDEAAHNSAARSCMLKGILYFFLMFTAVIYHSLDNKFHLFTNLVPINIREALYLLCPMAYKQPDQLMGTASNTDAVATSPHTPQADAQFLTEHLVPHDHSSSSSSSSSSHHTHTSTCNHKHVQNDSRCVYMRLVKKETLDALDPMRIRTASAVQPTVTVPPTVASKSTI